MEKPTWQASRNDPTIDISGLAALRLRLIELSTNYVGGYLEAARPQVILVAQEWYEWIMTEQNTAD